MRKHPLVALSACTIMSFGIAAGVVGGTSTHLSSATAAQNGGEFVFTANLVEVVGAGKSSPRLPFGADDRSMPSAPTGPELVPSARAAALIAGRARAWRLLHAPKPKPKPRVVAVPVVHPAQLVAAVPAPVRRASVVPVLTVPSTGVWYRLRMCESGGNYNDNTGNGYYGAYQFAASTWSGLGLPGLPNQASPAVQDEAAKMLQARSGWGQWPSCSAQLGL
jgi:hypothetical protein